MGLPQQRHASFVKQQIAAKDQQQKQGQNSSYPHFHKSKQSSTLTKLKHKDKAELAHGIKEQGVAGSQQAFLVTNCSQQRQRVYTTKA